MTPKAWTLTILLDAFYACRATTDGIQAGPGTVEPCEPRGLQILRHAIVHLSNPLWTRRWRSAVPEPCFVHPDRDALNRLNVPCAPNGGLWVCEECDADRATAFAHYHALHAKRVEEWAKLHAEGGK